MITEEGLDADPHPGLNHKSLLQEGKKRRDPIRGEIELDGEKRMKPVFEGMGRIVFHEENEKKSALFNARGMRNQKVKIIARDPTPSRNPPLAPL